MPRLKPNTFKEVYCRVCGALNMVKRNQMGPTSWGAAMAGKESFYDEFQCPNAEYPWHKEAVKMQREMEETTSQRVKQLYQQDLEEILAEHDCKLPESGEYLIVFDEIKQMKQKIMENGENYITIETGWRGEPTCNSIYFYDQHFYVILPDFNHKYDLEDYHTFAEAFNNPMLNRIDEFTISVTSDVFTATEIISRMKNLVVNEKIILINGEPVQVKKAPPNYYHR